MVAIVGILIPFFDENGIFFFLNTCSQFLIFLLFQTNSLCSCMINVKMAACKHKVNLRNMECQWYHSFWTRLVAECYDWLESTALTNSLIYLLLLCFYQVVKNLVISVCLLSYHKVLCWFTNSRGCFGQWKVKSLESAGLFQPKQPWACLLSAIQGVMGTAQTESTGVLLSLCCVEERRGERSMVPTALPLSTHPFELLSSESFCSLL